MTKEESAAGRGPSRHPSQPGGGKPIDSTTSKSYRDIDDETLAAIPRILADQSRAFQNAAKAAECGASAAAGEGASSRSQGRNVAEWARLAASLIPDAEVDKLPLVSNSTSEHEVHFRESDRRAVKRTWAGFYGQVPSPENGKLGRKNATPAEYLRRMALHNAIFGSDLKLEGVTVSDKPRMILGQPPGEPSFVISQPWFDKAGRATNEDIAARMAGEGFRPVPDAYYGWYRPKDGVVVVDAKPDKLHQNTSRHRSHRPPDVPLFTGATPRSGIDRFLNLAHRVWSLP